MRLNRAQLDYLFGLADKLSFELSNLSDESPSDALAKELSEKAEFVYCKIDEMRCEKMKEFTKTER